MPLLRFEQYRQKLLLLRLPSSQLRRWLRRPERVWIFWRMDLVCRRALRGGISTSVRGAYGAVFDL